MVYKNSYRCDSEGRQHCQAGVCSQGTAPSTDCFPERWGRWLSSSQGTENACDAHRWSLLHRQCEELRWGCLQLHSNQWCWDYHSQCKSHCVRYVQWHHRLVVFLNSDIWKDVKKASNRIHGNITNCFVRYMLLVVGKPFVVWELLVMTFFNLWTFVYKQKPHRLWDQWKTRKPRKGRLQWWSACPLAAQSRGSTGRRMDAL